MSIPDEVRTTIRDLLWERATQLGWSSIADNEKSRQYELWTREEGVGGLLGHYMDPRKVRVYIKDSLMKPFERARLSKTEEQILARCRLDGGDDVVVERYIKPHGVRFVDGRVICWGNSRDWKLILMALYERAASSFSRTASGIVFLESGNTLDDGVRELVRSAATKLGVEHVHWIEL